MNAIELDRFMAKVTPEPNTGCWLWSGAAISAGYGYACVGGKNVRAHRAAYAHFTGPILGDLRVCHRCDQPACVNPAHLWLGTDKENCADKIRKGRHARNEQMSGAVGRRGAANNKFKITDEILASARILMGDGRHGALTATARALHLSPSGLRAALETRP